MNDVQCNCAVNSRQLSDSSDITDREQKEQRVPTRAVMFCRIRNSIEKNAFACKSHVWKNGFVSKGRCYTTYLM